MPIVTPEKLVSLQKNAEDIRNICVLAHVDHGKTSLTDALIATNGIISPKLAGKVRYLDSRPDEQLRGITMESSAISLCFSLGRRPAPDTEPVHKDYLINLIDSPGHVDFSSEVSTASRLCDGAVVLVDAVEGVCSQTVMVLRQTWLEHLKPLLVINKVDRLVTELKMSPGEAYVHMSKTIEQVNAVLGSFFQGERMEEDLQWREKVEERVKAAASKEQDKLRHLAADKSGGVDTEDLASEAIASTNGVFEERDDEDLYFAPEKNNVIFSSAIDGWAFTVRQFASLYEKKLGIKRSVLEKVLWGDFYLDPKTKRVLSSKHLKGRALKHMFVQLVLENIWAVYEATTGGNKGKGDPGMLEKITKSLSITIPPHILRSRDPRALLTTVFGAWLPLSTALLISVIEQLPSPPVAQASRLPALIDASPGASHVDRNVREAMATFKTSPGDPIVAFVSKMVSVPASELPQNKRRAGNSMTAEEARDMARKKRAEIAKAQAAEHSHGLNGVNGITEALSGTSIDEGKVNEGSASEQQEEPEYLIGFARLYSGTLAVGDSVYVLPPKFSPANPHAVPEPVKVTVTALYLLMGRALEPLTSVPAGAVFGIGGLEGHILKSGTLCSQLEGSVNLAGISMGSQPIVRVALEPVNPSDLDKMITGLRLLEQSDPCAQYEVLESGEHVILTAGELHLERCLKDLRERFARCEIQAGEPIVPYRETIVNATEMAAPKNRDLPRGTVIGITTSKLVTIRLRVKPLPPPVTAFLEKNSSAIRRIYSEKKAQEELTQDTPGGEMTEAVEGGDSGILSSRNVLSTPDFKKALKTAFAEEQEQSEEWQESIDNLTAFGPRRTGPSLLIDMTPSKLCRKFLQEQHEVSPQSLTIDPSLSEIPSTITPEALSDKISYAFQLATAHGPLCHEPIQGIAVLLEDVTLAPSPDSDSENIGRLTGEVIKTVRESIHTAFLDWSPRLLLATYSCEIQCTAEVLGPTYATLSRRHATILAESLHEGTPFFTILSHLPLASSFGFADEIRKRTSGAAQPQLVFCGFEMLDEDPFWVPSTEEELEDLGTWGDRENVAKAHMDGVRRRKGLLVMERRGRVAEKQKTLKR